MVDAVKNAAQKVKDLASVHSSELILVTGGSGFAASHVLDAFLSQGYRVRTTVRSEAKAQAVKNSHKRHADKLEFAIVPDVAAPGAHDEAVKGVDGVIHTASPFHFNVTDNKEELLDPAVHGTTSVLHSIQKNAPQVKRVVITSSFAAILDLNKGTRPGYTYSEKDWNPVTQQEAEAGIPPVAYSASKTFAERAAYDFVEQHKPNFTVAGICPPYIFGPVGHDADINHLNTSSQELWQYVNGSLKGKAVPETGFPVFVDVRDVAQAHLKAYQKGGPNERFFVIAGQYQNPDIAKLIIDKFPAVRDNVPDPASTPRVETYAVDNSKSRTELGLTYLPFEKVITDAIKSLLELEKAQQEGRKLEWNASDYA